MTSSIYNNSQPLIMGSAFTFTSFLISTADPGAIKVNPTLESGDVKISVDSGAQGNIAILPTHIGAGQLSVTLLGAETTGVTRDIVVIFKDVAGAEWSDCAYVITAEASVTVAAVDPPTVAEIWNHLLTSITIIGSIGKLIKDYLDATISSRSTYNPSGSGAIEYTPNRVTDPLGNPLDGVDTWVTTNATDPTIGIQARANTNAFGLIDEPFLLDVGTYYVWRRHGSYTFTNPEQVVIS